MTAPDSDCLQRFHFEDSHVRGDIVRLDASLDEILGQHFYPAAITALLGEALAASVLLGSTIKFAGSLSLQARSDGPVSILFAECTHERRIRGYARVADGAVAEGLGELLRQGTLAITITPDDGQRYQGIVPLDAPLLSACLEHYFAQSEQLPSAIWLACDGKRAAGLMLQALPASAGGQEAPTQALRWEHLQQLANTVTEVELLDEPFETLLYHLFHQEGVRVQPPQSVAFGCRCSRQRAIAALESLGAAEVQSILAEQGNALIHCEFCQQEYRFEATDLEPLFAVAVPAVTH